MYYFSPVNLIMLGLVDASLSSKKIKAFMYAETDSTKGGSNVLRFTLTCLDTLGCPVPLSKNQNMTTEVATPDDRAIRLDLNINFDNCGGEVRTRAIMSWDLY